MYRLERISLGKMLTNRYASSASYLRTEKGSSLRNADEESVQHDASERLSRRQLLRGGQIRAAGYIARLGIAGHKNSLFYPYMVLAQEAEGRSQSIGFATVVQGVDVPFVNTSYKAEIPGIQLDYRLGCKDDHRSEDSSRTHELIAGLLVEKATEIALERDIYGTQEYPVLFGIVRPDTEHQPRGLSAHLEWAGDVDVTSARYGSAVYNASDQADGPALHVLRLSTLPKPLDIAQKIA